MGDVREIEPVAQGEGEEDTDVPEFLPPFANTENKDIHRQIQGLEVSKDDLDTALEDNVDRVKIMDEHLKNVHQELNFTEARVGAKKKEIETEGHLKTLSDRETGRIKTEKKNLQKEFKELEERINGLQIQVYKGNEKLDQFKLVMNWNQDELDQWVQAQKQKEEDNVALENYRHHDDAIVRDLNLHIERLTRQVVQRKEDLEQEVTETQAAQIQLDKTAQDFRNLHKERQGLLQQWDDAVEAMRRRDRLIELANERFADRKAMLRRKQSDIDAQARFLENELANNKEIEAQIEVLDREVGKLRDMNREEHNRTTEIGDEVDVIQNTLRKAANDLAQRSTENNNAKQELDTLRKRLDDARKNFVATRRKLESEINQLDTLELRDNELQAMYATEERHLSEAKKEVGKLESEQYKQGQKLFQERHMERESISEIAGAHSQNKNLKAKIAQLEDQIQKQQELLYNVEFQVVLMERKVARAQGERSDAETKELNKQIEKLTQELEGVNTEHAMLLAQLKKAEDDLSHARRRSTKLNADKGKLENSIDALSLETDMIQRSIKSAVETKENKMVDHDVLKLQVKRLRDLLALRADEVYTLENRKAQLKLSMDGRKQEIDVHRDALKVELKNARDDIHRVTLELKERNLRAEKLKNKYNTLSTKNQSIFDDEPKSQAYFLIKAAQEREGLQMKGDELDSKIRKAEKEVSALETTLTKLIGVNAQMGQSQRRVSSDTSVSQRLELREKLDKAYDKLKFKRTEEMNVSADIQQADARLNSIVQASEGLKATVEELTKRKEDAEKQLQAQREKHNRAKKRASKLKSEIRAKEADPDQESPFVQDIRLAQMRDVNRTMLHELKGLAAQNPEACITESLESEGIKLPSAPPTPQSSLTSSRAHSPRPTSARSMASVGSYRSRPASGSSQGPTVTTIQLGAV